MSQDTSVTLRISDISCHGLPTAIGFTKKPGKFYLKLMIEGQPGPPHQTPVADPPGDPVWNAPLLFSIPDQAVMTIQVYAKRRFPLSDRLIGELSLPLRVPDASTTDNAENERVTRPLSKETSKKSVRTGGSIGLVLHYLKSKKTAQAESALELDEESTKKVNEAMAKMQRPERVIDGANGILSVVGGAMGGVTDMDNLWAPLFEKVGLFIKVLDVLSDIHPYAAIAWAVLSQPLKAIIAQSERDQEIYALLLAMNRIYELVLSMGPLKIVEAHLKTAILMCQQTTECALFIRDYASRSFTKRMIMSPIKGYSSKAVAYIDTFNRLREDFQTESAIVTEVTVFQISAKTNELLSEVKELTNIHYLDDLPYASKQAEPDECYAGTRGAIIAEITKWFAQPLDKNAERVFWLYGVAGCGKSTIAQSIARKMRTQRRCVSFFFDASRQAEAGLDHLFATLSLDLADISADWKASLIKTVRNSIKARKSSTLQSQFENLLLEPAKDLDGIGPVLVVIDALDESGSQEERKGLLHTLAKIKELHIHFRFLVTSRPESDIVDALGDHTWVRPRRLDEVDRTSIDQDIRSFVHHQLLQIRALKDEWADEWVDDITARSNQLFQWARTACKYISGDGSIACNPLERLQELLSSSSFDGLDGLYTSILDSVSTFQPGDKASRRFRIIMGRVLSVREPLNLEALSSLWYNEEDRKQVNYVLSPLGSLLRGVSGQHEPIQPLHASFIDFLKDEKRSGKYWIDLQHQDEMMSRACLREMEAMLKFNICELETSYKLNDEVMDLGFRVDQCIPSHLSYACCFWVDHLRSVKTTNTMTPIREWGDYLYGFMRHHFFFWLEVLSLLNKVERSLVQLAMLRDWFIWVNGHEELKQLVLDSLRFVDVAAPVLRQSTPHLYLSALSFIPHKSSLSQLYLPAFPGSIDIEGSDNIQWSRMLLNIDTSSPLWSIALSPDGKRIVSGSKYYTWSIWDVETGNLVIGPIYGHSDEIESVAFSPDGKNIASGSDDTTVRIWDAQTGGAVTDSLSGHTDIVSSVVFSPNGWHVASSSFDKTIRIWDWRTSTCTNILANGHDDAICWIAFSSDGVSIASGAKDHKVIIWNWATGGARTLSGHSDIVRGVAFSNDGKYLVSCAEDKTIVVWDTDTGRQTLAPLTGHMDHVYCAAFSPDGHFIASGSRDNTVRVWDARTGILVAGPFGGYGNSVYSVVFSLDGKHVISGSEDGDINVWDVDAGKGLMISPYAHAQPISSVIYSPDGRYFASASWDGTVRLWSSTTALPACEPFRGHTDNVHSIAFSPNGKRIVSGSKDKSVRIWDIETREQIQVIAHSAETETAATHSDRVWCVAFSPDGTRVASGSDDKSVRIWDAETGRLIGHPFLGHTHSVYSVVFSPDGEYVVSGSMDRTLRIWDAFTGEIVTGPLDANGQYVTCLAFSPDSTLLISGLGNGSIKLWNVKTWDEKSTTGQFQSHTHLISSIQFSSDGWRVISASYDKTVRIWDVETGTCIAGPFNHTHDVVSAAFSPDGTRFISGLDDSTIGVWKVDVSGNTRKHGLGTPINAVGTSTPPARPHPDLGLFTDSSIFEDGWMRGPNDELLFWIPPDYRSCIERPSNTALIPQAPIRLNLGRFVHGKEWAKCFDGSKL